MLGNSCDPAEQACSNACESETHAGEGLEGTPAQISFDGNLGDAYWVNVEPDELFGGSSFSYDIEVQCSCD